jgi:1-acyl-sn-glycerol-3-phosphate acyltransferase
MKKIVDYLLSTLYLIHFGLSLLIFHVIQVVALNVFGKKAHKKTVDYLNFTLNFGLYITGARVSLYSRTTLPQDRPIIFIANHQSMFDISGMTWFLRAHHPRFVSKIELAKGIPSISYNLRHGGAAIIDRADGKKALIEIARLGKLIHDEKSSAIIFPEGTRTASGNMRPFQPGGVATLLKKAPDALIVPVAIRGTGKLNPKGMFPLTSFTKVSWTVLPGIEPSDKKLDDVLLEARSAIQGVLDEKE